jgi:hypothetical protein
MKFIITITLFCFNLSAFAQTKASSDSLYIVTYTTGPTWDFNKEPGDQIFFKEHSANLSKLRKDGVIKAGARYAEKGIIVIAAKSSLIARQIIFNDPAVVNKLFVADLQKLQVFYEGCLESPK